MQKTYLTKYIVVGLSLLCLTACIRKVETVAEKGQVEIAAGVPFNLLSPESFGSNLFLTQTAELNFKGEEHSLLLYTDVTSEQIVIVGLLPAGTRLFSIIYDGETVTSEGYSAALEHIKPEYFLADFQLAQWPLSALLSELDQSSQCFNQGTCSLVDSADRLSRVLKKGGVELVTIQYDSPVHYHGTTRLFHKSRDYELEIATIDVETRE